ncbi:cytidine deaminase [Vagococcus intermedius]|uniref:Cytidine deaminase n=1 Tax=Vagococcus intermedius TaxID=2991418 RepID=A0AAF0CUW6_9ENTE|nr:cytidine deaminase [Vagococcus intermedius]WEG73358.1 cytidine deaminase [Vagococcus intermedius]WEG75439.1 cytidine deaminase [Vagococcus intermedius]
MCEKDKWIEIARAQATKENAYVPYSKFPVGACLITEDNQVFTGVNIENASYGLTNCAERTAIFKAVSEGHRKFKQIVIAGNTDTPISPCGACRQVMAEFCEPSMPVTLVAGDGSTLDMTLEQLLPYSFTEKQL